jgi:hypothetical protein
MSLENAPKHIQLAVDLIDLLETNNIDTEVAIQALEIVLKDFKQKHTSPQDIGTN